jgi:hypothetical protein
VAANAGSSTTEEADMASREQKGNKEKKKPKADKNKAQKHQPFGGKTPMGQFSQPQIGEKK